ncbi:DUF922 domain-containing protein [Pseudocolwellia sp. HL-MZ19]|uniref:DUF922 domain-containing protein n=1 Tax=Pseudocolwellia sp. HL-MZ19 TaxID=3400846 RepID=UPI003CF08C09
MISLIPSILLMTKIFVCFLLFLNINYANATDKVSADVSVSYYDVKADSVDDLFEKIKINGPKVNNKSAWATLRWDLNTEYHFKRTSNTRCRFVTREVSVIAEIILPNWENINEQENDLQRWWKKFSKYIEDHENKHLDNIIYNSKVMTEKIKDLPFFDGCSGARNNYLSVKHDILGAIRKADKIIDKNTFRDIQDNKPLFRYLPRQMRSITIESGGMQSYITF